MKELAIYAARPEDQWEIVLEQPVIPETAKALIKTGVLLVDTQLADPDHKVETINMEE